MALSAKPELKKYMKRVMPFVQAVREKVSSSGLSALNLTLDFDEIQILNSNKAYLENTLDVCICTNIVLFPSLSIFYEQTIFTIQQIIKCIRYTFVNLNKYSK